MRGGRARLTYVLRDQRCRWWASEGAELTKFEELRPMAASPAVTTSLTLAKKLFRHQRLPFLVVALAAAVLIEAGTLANAGSSGTYPPMFSDPAVFLKAIEQECPQARLHSRVTGITIPHHLLAADLIARGFCAAAASTVDRVILLSPDHFHRAKRPFATSAARFRTALGMLAPDRAAVSSLASRPDLFEQSSLFRREHGIAALLPFVAHFFPKAGIVPIAVSPNAKRADWERAIARLLPLIGPHTLVVQSTDFSHYLPSWIAQQRDQETLNVLSANSPDGVAALVPTDHLDSKGSQYIQMRLQAAIGARGPVVIANRNASEYSRVDINSTSYIVQVFSSEDLDPHALQYSDQQIIYFGGDTLFGRYMTPLLIEEAPRQAMFAEIRRVTGGLPLIVNLEGVALEDIPEQLPEGRHVMPTGLTVPGLKAINAVAASLANNHSFDLGPVGLEETLAALRRAGVRPLEHGEIADFGTFRLLALNFISKRQIPGFPVAEGGELAETCRREARPPLLAFVHWGIEYATAADQAEHALASQLLDCGVTAVIGAHSHRASPSIEAVQGGAQQITYSLGNLLFDQNGSGASGAILELRIFKQGTFATRLLPIANLYELGKRQLSNTAAGAGSEVNTAD